MIRYLPLALVFLTACHSGTDTRSAAGLQLPEPLRNSQAIQFSNVYAEIRVNGGPVQTYRFNSDEPVDIDLVGVNVNAINTIAITWIETFENLPLVLATQQGEFSADAEAAIVSIDLPYDYSADDDGDQQSNIDERRLGQCPRNACTGETGSETDQTTTTPTNTEDLTTDTTSDETEKSAIIPVIVRIEPGCFDIGSPPDEPYRREDEAQKNVCINQAFGMSKFEITERQFEASLSESIEDATTSIKPKTIVTLGWATDYVKWLSDYTGRNFRLPTEAEWEYAARAGTTTTFSTGDIITSDQANFNGLFPFNGRPTGGTNLRRVVDVGNYQPNPWGLYDMHGNVVEWTCSVFAIPFDGSELSCTDPADTEMEFMVRGGTYYSHVDGLRSAARYGLQADYTGGGTGFRIVEVY